MTTGGRVGLANDHGGGADGADAEGRTAKSNARGCIYGECYGTRARTGGEVCVSLTTHL